MQLAFDECSDVTIVRVKEAKLTYPVLSSFFAEVRQKVEGGARKVVIDLSVVSYLDSASIGCLMDVHRLLQEKGGGLRLSGHRLPDRGVPTLETHERHRRPPHGGACRFEPRNRPVLG